MNQELQNYIKQSREVGKTNEQIKQELLNVGWLESDINKVFSNMIGVSVPSPRKQQFVNGKKQLHPRAIWLFFFGSNESVVTFILLIALIAVYFPSVIVLFRNIITVKDYSKVIFWSAMVFAMLAIIANYILARLSYHFYRYELTENSFRKEYGIIFKKYVTIPYDRIQNVDISRGILARLLSLSDLHIQTAGAASAMAEGRLPGVSVDEAEYLRDDLI